ncbi:MAG: hypothetical protein ABIK28_10345 [Planctomycetota bacterium]
MRKHHIVMLLFCVLCRGAAVVEERPGVAKASPHFNASLCGACHGRDLPEEAEACGGYSDLYNRQCMECHESVSIACRFHTGIIPQNEELRRIGSLFPLDEDRLTCLSCHDARIQCVDPSDPASSSNPMFLRRNNGKEKTRFCFACHNSEPFKTAEAHSAGTGSEYRTRTRCLYCHAALPETGSVALRTDLELTCRVCHENTNPLCEKHYGYSVHLLLPEGASGPGPVRDKDAAGSGDREKISAQRFMTTQLPLTEEQKVCCVTCHDPHHDPNEGRSLLRLPEGDSLCRCCHIQMEDRKVSE